MSPSRQILALLSIIIIGMLAAFLEFNLEASPFFRKADEQSVIIGECRKSISPSCPIDLQTSATELMPPAEQMRLLRACREDLNLLNKYEDCLRQGLRKLKAGLTSSEKNALIKKEKGAIRKKKAALKSARKEFLAATRTSGTRDAGQLRAINERIKKHEENIRSIQEKINNISNGLATVSNTERIEAELASIPSKKIKVGQTISVLVTAINKKGERRVKSPSRAENPYLKKIPIHELKNILAKISQIISSRNIRDIDATIEELSSKLESLRSLLAGYAQETERTLSEQAQVDRDYAVKLANEWATRFAKELEKLKKKLAEWEKGRTTAPEAIPIDTRSSPPSTPSQQPKKLEDPARKDNPFMKGVPDYPEWKPLYGMTDTELRYEKMAMERIKKTYENKLKSAKTAHSLGAASPQSIKDANYAIEKITLRLGHVQDNIKAIDDALGKLSEKRRRGY